MRWLKKFFNWFLRLFLKRKEQKLKDDLNLKTTTGDCAILQVRLGGQIVNAEVVKINDKTIWVRISNGDVIKRHKRKHVIA